MKTFDGGDSVQVVLDRRVTERRGRRAARRKTERRQTGRRAQREIDRQLRARGYAVVGVRTFQRPPSGASARAEGWGGSGQRQERPYKSAGTPKD